MAKRVQARLRVNGREVYLGRWPSQRDAHVAADRAALMLKLERRLRYPNDAHRLGAASPAQLIRESHALVKRRTSSRFAGVSWNAALDTWMVTLQANGKPYAFSGFADEERAAIIRDRLALHLFGKAAALNFPQRRLKPASYAELQRELRTERTASQYRGVSYDTLVQRFRWSAGITIGYSNVFLGRYPTECDAAIAYDRAARYYLGKSAKLNLPQLSNELPPADAGQLRKEVRAQLKKLTSSPFRGVYPCGQNWSARIAARRQAHYLGTFATEEEAAEAYDKAAKRLHGARARLNFEE